jgi:hypothetical protein
MKIKIYLMVITLLMLVFLPTQAQDWSKLSKDEAESVKRLATKMCTQLQMSKTAKHEDSGWQIEKHLLNRLKITREDPDYKLKVAKFWNKYAEYFVCDIPGGRRNPQHFLKRVVDMDFYETILYDFLLSDEEEYPISVNAIEIYQGKEETFLDYLNAILAVPSNNDGKYNFKEIKLLRSIIIDDYGAKTASELKKE